MDELRGRRRILTDVKRIDHTNIIQVLSESMIDHSYNREQIRFLMDYEKGIQPILNRTKENRPEINIKIVENNAAKITDFKVSYEYGNPITYIQRSRKQSPDSDPDKDDIRITALNEMLFEESKVTKDIRLANFFKICGVGYRMIKAKPYVTGRSVFDIIILNPMTTFVVYSNDIYQRPMLAVTYCQQRNGNTLYGCYTDDTYFEVDNGMRIINGVRSLEDWSITNGIGVANIPAIIPIVEYVNDFDRMGCFEKVIPELDGINITISDMANDVAQHVQNLIWMNNCELEDGTKLETNGVIQTKSPTGLQANISFIESRIDLSGTQRYVDDLRRNAMEITGVPQRQENSGGGSTGSAMNLSSGWQFAETMAHHGESVFEESERQSIRIMLEIIKKSNDIPDEIHDIVNLRVSDVEIKHNRNKIYDIATKVNAMSTMIRTGIDGKHAIETVCLFTDPQGVWNDSKAMIQKIQDVLMQTNETPTSNATDSVDFVDANKMMPDMSDQPQKSPQSEA